MSRKIDGLPTFNVSDHLNSPEMIAEYLTTIPEQGEPRLLMVALRDVAKARGMLDVLEASSIGSQSAGGEVSIEFGAVIELLTAFGLKVRIESV